jgi:hypothetical protein
LVGLFAACDSGGNNGGGDGQANNTANNTNPNNPNNPNNTTNNSNNTSCGDGQCQAGEAQSCPQDCGDDNNGIKLCTTQADCGELACIGGRCAACVEANECGEGFLCIEERCAPRCDTEAGRCEVGERCDASTGMCAEGCDEDGDCPEGQRCDTSSNACAEQEGCDGPEDCDPGQVCQGGQCVAPEAAGPRFFGGLCAGCEQSNSAQHRAATVLGPVELVGEVSTSPEHTLLPGTLTIIQPSP